MKKGTLTKIIPNPTTSILNPFSTPPSLQMPTKELTRMWDCCCISIEYLVPITYRNRTISITFYHPDPLPHVLAPPTLVTGIQLSPPISPRTSLCSLDSLQSFWGAASSEEIEEIGNEKFGRTPSPSPSRIWAWKLIWNWWNHNNKKKKISLQISRFLLLFIYEF